MAFYVPRESGSYNASQSSYRFTRVSVHVLTDALFYLGYFSPFPQHHIDAWLWCLRTYNQAAMIPPCPEFFMTPPLGFNNKSRRNEMASWSAPHL